MPRYFFHLREGDRFTEDKSGIELPDIAAAREETFRRARALLARLVGEGRVIDGQEYLVLDDKGRQLATIPIKSALHVE